MYTAEHLNCWCIVNSPTHSHQYQCSLFSFRFVPCPCYTSRCVSLVYHYHCLLNNKITVVYYLDCQWWQSCMFITTSSILLLLLREYSGLSPTFCESNSVLVVCATKYNMWYWRRTNYIFTNIETSICYFRCIGVQ